MITFEKIIESVANYTERERNAKAIHRAVRFAVSPASYQTLLADRRVFRCDRLSCGGVEMDHCYSGPRIIHAVASMPDDMIIGQRMDGVVLFVVTGVAESRRAT